MKIACVTLSDPNISRFSVELCEELAEYNEVVIFYVKDPFLSPSFPIKSKLTVIEISPKDVDKLKEYDVTLYNTSGSSYFVDAYELMQMHAGVAIIHDINYHFFFEAGYFPYKNLPPRSNIEILGNQIYGDKFIQDRIEIKNNSSAMNEYVNNYTFIEPILNHVKAIVTHSKFLLDKCLNYKDMPAVLIPLSYKFSTMPVKKFIAPTCKEKLILLTITTIDIRRRIESVLHALASEAILSESFDYYVIGRVDGNYAFSLYELAKELNVSDNLHIMGYVSDEDVIAIENKAVARLNLRYPTGEGSSYSAFSSLDSGRPTLVIDTASYSDFPDDCVVKVRPDHEIEDIKKFLHQLIDQSEEMQQVGLNGREYLRNTHSAVDYASRLNIFLKEIYNL